MSFLNPVSEPVLRFSSTDADAPQINYASRTAGDVKTVLKACLATGYGTTAGAGWTVVNEVDHVAEFVSPSVIMSDYRLGIDDTSASSTTWYYQYQDTLKNMARNDPAKSMSHADKSHASNGWELLVTNRGILFIELVQHSAVNKLSSRITYWGQVKSMLGGTTGENIMFFNFGHSSKTPVPSYFYSDKSYQYFHLESHTSALVSSATAAALSIFDMALDAANVDLVSPIYLASSGRDLLIAELPAMLSKIVNKTTDLYGISEIALNGRNTLSVCAGFEYQAAAAANARARTFLIPLDYWEY